LRIGENCAVIGIGILGQLACQMLRASGVKVIGIDVNNHAVEIAQKNAADLAFLRNTNGLDEKIKESTNGIGVDAVIIAAATNSLDPVNFAGSILRKKGRLIILGAVPTGFDRDPHYYRKELELKMACSYGPGRYDPDYEEKGIDYPVAYVRWTEKRNMEAFQYLLYSKKINIDYLITHEYILDEAPKAFDMIVNKTEPYLGILIKYDASKKIGPAKIITKSTTSEGKVTLAFIGAGSYAQGNILPNIPKNDPNIALRTVLTQTGTTSKRVAERFSFESCTSEESDIFENPNINTVFIATRHNTHAEFVIKGLNSKKNIFVEKPLCLTLKELEQISKALIKSNEKQLMVGFNRRFSPLTDWIKERLPDGPMSILYRINAGFIPADSWIQDPEIGGGRIIGEICHFIDYLTYISSSLPVRIYASSIPDPFNFNDTINLTLEFENGTSGIIAYYANGSSKLNKEYIEIFSSGIIGTIDNFKEARTISNKKIERKKLLNQDKGQKNMISRFMKSLVVENSPLIPFEEIYAITKSSILAQSSLSKHQPIEL